MGAYYDFLVKYRVMIDKSQKPIEALFVSYGSQSEATKTKLVEAQKMYDPKAKNGLEVLEKTNCVQIGAGQWRYIADDKPSDVNFNNLLDSKGKVIKAEAKVGEIFSGEILKDYPQLRDVTVKIVNSNEIPGEGGEYNAATKTIKIAKADSLAKDDPLVLLTNTFTETLMGRPDAKLNNWLLDLARFAELRNGSSTLDTNAFTVLVERFGRGGKWQGLIGGPVTDERQFARHIYEAMLDVVAKKSFRSADTDAKLNMILNGLSERVNIQDGTLGTFAQTTMLHELQHVVQDIEKTSTGGAMTYANVEADTVSTSGKHVRELQKTDGELGKEYGLAVREEAQQYRNYKKGEIDKEDYLYTKAKAEKAKKAFYAKATSEGKATAEKLERLVKNVYKTTDADALAYWKMLGEQEARLAARMADVNARKLAKADEEICNTIIDLFKDKSNKDFQKIAKPLAEYLWWQADASEFAEYTYLQTRADKALRKIANNDQALEVLEMIDFAKNSTDVVRKLSLLYPAMGYNTDYISVNAEQGKSASPVANGSVEGKLAGAIKTSKPISLKEKAISFKNNPMAWLKEKWQDFYLNWVDKNDLFKDIDRKLAKALGRKLNDSEKIYGRAQGIKSSANGTMDVLIGGGKEELAGLNKRLQNVKLKHANGSMKQVLENIKEDVLDNASKAFMKKYGFGDSVEALGSALTWRRLREMDNISKQAHAEWEKNGRKGEEPEPYKLPNGLTRAELDKGIASVPKQFLKACDDYYAMNDNLLCLLEDAGVISTELHNLLNTTYREYCPLQRDFSDTQGLEDYLNGFAGGSGPANVSNMIKKINKDGSERNIINPLETTIAATMMASRRAERNKVCQKLVKLADVKGMETVIQPRWHWAKKGEKGGEKVIKNGKVVGMMIKDTARPEDSTFTVMEDGVKKTYWCDPMYYQSVVGYDAPASNIAYDAMAVFAQWLRTGATMTPSFIVRNGFRDSVLAGYMTNVGFKPILGTINGIKKLHAKNGKEADINALFKAMGFGSMTRERDGNAIYNDLKKQVASDKIDFTNPVSLWDAFKGWFVGMNEDVELGTRRELFGLAIEKGYADYKAGKITFEELVQQAAEVGRFGTTDFTRSGIKGQQVNRLAAFFNANVQGVDLFAQGLINPETRPRMLAFIGTYIAMPCLAIWAANHDKDWWKELDPETKYTNFCVSESFRVPLPQEAGVMFGGGLMAMLDMAMDNDPKAMGVWGGAVKSALAPNPIPTAVMPILEWQANYNFFRNRPIVNQRLQKLPDEMQYDNYTTEMSKILGEITGLSPKKIDNTVQDVRATQGMMLWEGLGDILSYAMGKDNVRADTNLNEKMFVRDFNVTESKRNRYTNDFYEMWSEANKLHAGNKATRQQESALKSINAAQRVISKLNKEIREIGNPENTKFTSAQKQEMLAIRREKIKKVAKQANDKYGKYFE